MAIVGVRSGWRTLLASTALVAMVAGIGSYPAQAQSAAQAGTQQFDIPAQSLASALMRFSRETRLELFYNAELAQGRTTQGVSGNFAPAEALSRLLVGTGLTFKFTNATTITLERAPQAADGTIALGPVRVEGVAESAFNRVFSDPAATEATKSYAAQAVTIGKVPQTLREIPQSITVMTRQIIEDQSLDSVEQLLSRSPGVVFTTDAWARGLGYSRGFQIANYQLDGGNVAYDSGFRPNQDLAMYDRVEILRGSDGLFSGTGLPGGTINLVRKRPLREAQLKFAASAASWDNYRLEADATGPLALDGALRMRLVGVYQNRHFFYSPSADEKILVYGIVEADLGPDTLISVGGSHQWQDGAQFTTGLPHYTDGSDMNLPRSFATTADWAGRKAKNTEFFANIEHKFGESWAVKLSATQQKYSLSGLDFNAQGSMSADDTILFANPRAFEGSNKATVLEATLSGDFQLFGQNHSLIVGASYQKSKAGQSTYYTYDRFPDDVSIFDFDPLLYPEPEVGGLRATWPKYGAKQIGFYGKLHAHLTDNMSFILGGRVTSYNYSAPYMAYLEDGTIRSTSTTQYKENGILTPYGALIYAFDKNWSVYGSVAEIHQSQAQRLSGPLPGTPLKPITGRNYEIGIKGALRDETLNISLALYRIERNGEAVLDNSYPRETTDLGISCCYVSQGEVVSKGIDAEITGEITPGWQILMGYTFNINKNKKSDARYHTATPRHLLKVWTSYILPGELSAWTVGGGFTAQTKQYNSGSEWDNKIYDYVNYYISQKGYIVANATIDYKFNDRWSASFNLNNIFDKKYYQTLGTAIAGSWYGEPRNFRLTLRAGF
ncbi:TonB-dependent siderophore receptor [Sphingobium cloacae]|uniref:TonB-dependent siderophore receptor n=1 Tax=Sphingobium cloacae TaxID=120107 RepID=A0A1E1F0P9_9SPHN|nr:TonB-dependent receptor [Sphingobium cloacae]BAV64085.1 TonB-dependent siderophore receptor [Sphingobium cloacae]